jgi:two-component system, NarL family, response regulator DesR
VNPLTPRERDVLEASADGRTIAQIAGQLYLSEGTVWN